MMIPALCKNKRFSIKVFLLCAALFFCAHGFCFANLTYSGNSLMINASAGYQSYMKNGQFLIPYYLHLRGSLSAPSLVGIISFACLSVSAWLIVCFLDQHSTLRAAAICVSLFLFMPLTAINASMLHLADTYYVSLLLCILGAILCTYARWGFIPACMFLTAAFALQPSPSPVFFSLIILFSIKKLLDNDHSQNAALPLFKGLISVIAAIVAYSAMFAFI